MPMNFNINLYSKNVTQYDSYKNKAETTSILFCDSHIL